MISEKSAYILTDMLRGVITRGTGTGANIGRDAAGKTGTTSDYVDAWFVGYTPDLVTSVWMGNDSNGTLDGITGADTPATIWRVFMKQALAGTPAKSFIKPDGLVIDDTPSVLDTDKEKLKKEEEEKDKLDKDKLKDKDKTTKKDDDQKSDKKTTNKENEPSNPTTPQDIPAIPAPAKPSVPPPVPNRS